MFKLACLFELVDENVCTSVELTKSHLYLSFVLVKCVTFIFLLVFILLAKPDDYIILR